MNDVRHQNVDRPFMGPAYRQTFEPVSGVQNDVPDPPVDGAHESADGRFVIHQQNDFAFAACLVAQHGLYITVLSNQRATSRRLSCRRSL